MQNDIEVEVKRYYTNELVNDAASVKWVQILAALRLKWYREFDVRGRELAKWFAQKTDKRTMSQIQRKLKEFGFAISPSYTPEQKRLIKSIVDENVGMIKSIPQQYLRGVQKVTTGAFSRGGDMGTLSKYLDKELAVAAVDYSGECKDPAALGLSEGRYFNAGLLVIDLQAWQKAQISERALAYYQKYGNNLPLLDQDALNAAINGAFLELDKRFNFLIEVNNPLMAKYPENTVLLHCINESKAWTHGCLPEIYAIYRQYVVQSPWHDLQLSEPTTVKASFLAATSAELQGDYKQAQKYYIMTINSFTKYYQNTAPQLLATVKKDCLAAVDAEQQGETVLAVRYYGVAAKRLIEQYLQEEH